MKISNRHRTNNELETLILAETAVLRIYYEYIIIKVSSCSWPHFQCGVNFVVVDVVVADAVVVDVVVVLLLLCLGLVSHFSLGGEKNSNDETKEADSRAENFNNQNLDKECWVRSIGESSPAANLAHTDATNQVDHACGNSSSKHGVSREPVPGLDLEVSFSKGRGVSLELSSKHNSNNQSIDGHSLAEDDRDQVLGFDPGCLDTATDDGHAG